MILLYWKNLLIDWLKLLCNILFTMRSSAISEFRLINIAIFSLLIECMMNFFNFSISLRIKFMIMNSKFVFQSRSFISVFISVFSMFASYSYSRTATWLRTKSWRVFSSYEKKEKNKFRKAVSTRKKSGRRDAERKENAKNANAKSKCYDTDVCSVKRMNWLVRRNCWLNTTRVKTSWFRNNHLVI